MTTFRWLVVAVVVVVVIAGLVFWLYEIRFQRRYRERMERLRYRAERRGYLL